MVSIFLVAGVVVLAGERTVRSALDEMARVEEPARAASFGMEINSVEISQDLLNYLETGGPRYREQFTEDRAEFEEY